MIVIGKVTVTETVIGIAIVTVIATANVTDTVAGKTMAARDITKTIPMRILALKGGTETPLPD
jgi:hypothetical protein